MQKITHMSVFDYICFKYIYKAFIKNFGMILWAWTFGSAAALRYLPQKNDVSGTHSHPIVLSESSQTICVDQK